MCSKSRKTEEHSRGLVVRVGRIRLLMLTLDAAEVRQES